MMENLSQKRNTLTRGMEKKVEVGIKNEGEKQQDIFTNRDGATNHMHACKHKPKILGVIWPVK